jgi:hypothetical protein
MTTWHEMPAQGWIYIYVCVIDEAQAKASITQPQTKRGFKCRHTRCLSIDRSQSWTRASVGGTLNKEAVPFVSLISHQPPVLFSLNKPATSNQPAVFFSQNKSAPAINHQQNEQR